jgi:hypothetical protein
MAVSDAAAAVGTAAIELNTLCFMAVSDAAAAAGTAATGTRWFS